MKLNADLKNFLIFKINQHNRINGLNMGAEEKAEFMQSQIKNKSMLLISWLNEYDVKNS